MTRFHALTILDGGMSRELMRLNAPFRLPEWTAYTLLHSPEFVKQVHISFISAGADIITTNTYSINPHSIGTSRFHHQGTSLASLAGRLARESASETPSQTNNNRSVLIAGSLPPMFESYRPDLFNPSLIQEYLSVLIQGLTPYTDIWLGETLSSLREAQAVITATTTTGTHKPVWISFTLPDSPQPEPQVRGGDTIAEVTRWAVDAGVEAVLFNCSPPEVMGAAVREAKKVVRELGVEGRVRIGVYANAFPPESESLDSQEEMTEVREDLDCGIYANFAEGWVSDGASILGGCCGIGCGHIRELARRFDGR